jgi:hypothetical protein
MHTSRSIQACSSPHRGVTVVVRAALQSRSGKSSKQRLA